MEAGQVIEGKWRVQAGQVIDRKWRGKRAIEEEIVNKIAIEGIRERK